MKKIYEEVKVNVISLGASDVITTSFANRNDSILDDSFDLGDYSTQDF